MTIYNLQQQLQSRIEQAVEAAGFHGLQVYIRNLPPLKYEGDADQYFPHCVVSVGDGEDAQDQSKVTAVMVLGTIDKNPELKGYEEICHLIEILRLYFAEHPILDGYEIQRLINFTLAEQEVDTYPHFFGAVWFDVLIPGPGPDYSDLT